MGFRILQAGCNRFLINLEYANQRGDPTKYSGKKPDYRSGIRVRFISVSHDGWASGVGGKPVTASLGRRWDYQQNIQRRREGDLRRSLLSSSGSSAENAACS